MRSAMVSPSRGSRPGVGDVAARLMIAPHSAAELVARMERAGLVVKRRDPADARRVGLRLTPRARRLLARLTAAHLAELR